VTIKDPEQWRRPIEEQMALIRKLVEGGFLSGSGSGFPKEFEEELRRYIGAEYCLTLDHGSTALASAFYAVGVGPGDEIILPTVAYLGSYAGALHLGARPVLCEIDPQTLLIDPQDAERRITERTRAIVPIHYRGNPCDMDALMDIGRRHGVAIVEDAAHAHGAEWSGKRIGNVGDIAGFSLQGADPYGKPVSGGEGGVATTNHRELYERQLIYCHLHRAGIREELTNPAYRMFESEVLGLKWRAHPLALAIAKVSLDTLDYRMDRSAQYREKVFSALRELPGLEPAHSIREKQALLRRELRGRGLKLNYGDPKATLLESVLARGDRRLGAVVQRAWELGARFDAWGEQQNLEAWMRAFAEMGLDPDFYARRQRPPDETFPWEVVSTGVRREFLLEEYRRSKHGETLADCRERCHGCGILGAYGDIWSEEWRCPQPTQS